MRKKVINRIKKDIENETVGGVGVIVTQKGNVVLEEYFGSKKLGISVDENTMFRLASMTKPITAVAVLILADRGQIKLEDKISIHLPEFAELHSKITIKHLLSHTSGLGSETVGQIEIQNLFENPPTSLEEAVFRHSLTVPAFAPGERGSYSAIMGFDVLARLVEVISGCPFDVFLKDEIFGPLQMTDTTFSPTPLQWERMIPMHEYADGKGGVGEMRPNCMFGPLPITYHSGAAGLSSKPKDYLKFAQMLQQKGCYNGGRIISEDAYKGMTTCHCIGENDSWGYGVRVITKGQDEYLPEGCFGWSGAYGTHFWVDPLNEIIGIYFKNSSYDGGSGAMTSRNFEKDVYSQKGY